VSAVIVNYEGGRLLLDCLAGLDEQEGLIETIVVDNGSRDGSAAAATARFPGIKVITPGRNAGFAAGASIGARAARGDLVLFLNPDVILRPRCIPELVAPFADPQVGVVGPPLDVAISGGVEYGATIDLLGSPIGLSERNPPLYVPGCALMTRSALFQELGGFDERFFMFVEDVDYCWRVLLRGFDIRVPEIPPIRHAGGASMPGGYFNDVGLSSSLLRVVLRERNTLATLLKCYGAGLAVATVPAYILQSLATAALIAASGRTRTARAIVAGLRWNARHLRGTLALRRQIQISREVRDATIICRMYRGVWKLSVLTRFGVPRVSEAESIPLEAGL
jgi:glycosyltransferase involved in cell wall biosynthesis